MNINNIKDQLKEKDELVQLKDSQISSMDLESKNLKIKLKRYSVLLKNAVTEIDKLKARLTYSVDSEKLNSENNELVEKLKSLKELIREKNSKYQDPWVINIY